MHLDYEFPRCISFGSEGGPEYTTVVHEADNGARQVFIPWPVGRCRYDAQSGVKTLEDYEEIYKLFRICKGQAHTFDWYDWNDHKTSDLKGTTSFTDQTIATGDGVETRFKLYKKYTLASEVEARRIYRPDVSTLTVGVDGVLASAGWTWDAVAHELVFDVAPTLGHDITWGGVFYVPVAFTINYMPAAITNKNQNDFFCTYPIPVEEVTL